MNFKLIILVLHHLRNDQFRVTQEHHNDDLGFRARDTQSHMVELRIEQILGVFITLLEHVAEFLEILQNLLFRVFLGLEFRAGMDGVEIRRAFIVFDKRGDLFHIVVIAFEEQTVLLGDIVRHRMDIKRR